MGSTHTCDCRDCPAPAQHHVDIHGQDFHFCSHHWAVLAPALVAHLDAWAPRTGGPAAGDQHPAATPGARSG